MAIQFGASPGNYGGSCGIIEATKITAESNARNQAHQLENTRLNMQAQQHDDSMRMEEARLNASRTVSPKDVWEAQNRVASSLAINQGELSQAENMRLQRLRSAMSGIDEALGRNEITADHAAELRANAQGQIGPMEFRQRQAALQHQHEANEQLVHQNRISRSIQLDNDRAANGNTELTPRYDPGVLGDVVTRIRARYHPGQRTEQEILGEAQADMNRTGNGVEYGRYTMQPNGVLAWTGSNVRRTDRSTGSGGTGGTRGEQSGTGATPARDIQTILHLQDQFDKDWETTHKPTGFDTTHTTPEARATARDTLQRAWVNRRLNALEEHMGVARHGPENARGILGELRGITQFAQERHLQGGMWRGAEGIEMQMQAARLVRMIGAHHGIPAAGTEDRRLFDGWFSELMQRTERLRGQQRGGEQPPQPAQSEQPAQPSQPAQPVPEEIRGAHAAGETVRNIGANLLRTPQALREMGANAAENTGVAAAYRAFIQAGGRIDDFDRWLSRHGRGFVRGLMGR